MTTTVQKTHTRQTATTPTPSESRRFDLWAGRLGLLASAAYITTIAATSLFGSVEPHEGPEDIIRYLQEVADNSTQSQVYGIAGIIMSLLFMPLGIAAYRLLQRTAVAGLGALAMLIGLAALIPAYTVSILTTMLAPAATELGAGGAASLYAVTEAATGVLVISFTIGSVLTLSIAPMLWALEGRRTGALPSWLNRTGLLVGSTGLIWFIWFLETPAILIVVILNVVASLVYFIGLSMALLSRPTA